MKLRFENLKGFKLQAQDGEIGKIKDVLFDDQQWGGRWLDSVRKGYPTLLCCRGSRAGARV